MNKKNNTLTNVVLLRVFTILIVVFGHSIIFYSMSWSIFEPVIESAFLDALKGYIDVFQMPLFIFISGYVYNYNRIDRGKYSDINSFVKNKFTRLVVPFFSIALLYVLPIRLFVNYDLYIGESLISLIVNHAILGKDIGHLWYLQALFNIVVLFYLFEKVFRKFPIWLNLGVLISISVFSVYSPIVFNVHMTLRYIVYFYLGYVVREAKFEEKINSKIFGALFILQFTGLFFGYITSYISGSIVIKGLTLGFNILGSIFSCLFYYSFFTKVSQTYENLYEHKIIRYIDENSFGIYLFHSPLLYITLHYLSDELINPYVMVLILFTVMLFGSITITIVIKKIEPLGFMIGEKKRAKNLNIKKYSTINSDG